MNAVTVSHRTVARPWDRARLEGQRTTFVGREANVRPDPLALALYRRRWPTRDVAWDAKRQLFVITDRTDPGFREFVFEYDAPTDSGEPITEEELYLMVTSHAPGIYRVFVPFDYAFVRRRMKEADEYLELGSARYAEKVEEGNERIQRSWVRDRVNYGVPRLNEIKRYLPLLAGGEKQHLFTGADLTS